MNYDDLENEMIRMTDYKITTAFRRTNLIGYPGCKKKYK
jgi:hypothetical protein